MMISLKPGDKLRIKEDRLYGRWSGKIGTVRNVGHEFVSLIRDGDGEEGLIALKNLDTICDIEELSGNFKGRKILHEFLK